MHAQNGVLAHAGAGSPWCIAARQALESSLYFQRAQMLLSFGALASALLITLASLCCHRRAACACTDRRRCPTPAAATDDRLERGGGGGITGGGRVPERGGALSDSVGLPRLGGGVDGVRGSFKSRHGLGLSVVTSTPLHSLGVQTPHVGGRHGAPSAMPMALFAGGGGVLTGSSSGTPTGRDGLMAPAVAPGGLFAADSLLRAPR
jgi:hypothetical protein